MICPKCGGQGYIREYAHVSGGVCFHCNGRGTVGSGPQGKYTLKDVNVALDGLTKRQTLMILNDYRASMCYMLCPSADRDYEAGTLAGYYAREIQADGQVKYTLTDKRPAFPAIR